MKINQIAGLLLLIDIGDARRLHNRSANVLLNSDGIFDLMEQQMEMEEQAQNELQMQDALSQMTGGLEALNDIPTSRPIDPEEAKKSAKTLVAAFSDNDAIEVKDQANFADQFALSLNMDQIENAVSQIKTIQNVQTDVKTEIRNQIVNVQEKSTKKEKIHDKSVVLEQEDDMFKVPDVVQKIEDSNLKQEKEEQTEKEANYNDMIDNPLTALYNQKHPEVMQKAKEYQYGADEAIENLSKQLEDEESQKQLAQVVEQQQSEDEIKEQQAQMDDLVNNPISALYVQKHPEVMKKATQYQDGADDYW